MTSLSIIGVGKIVHSFLEGLQRSQDMTEYQLSLVGRTPTRNTQLAEEWNLPTLDLETALTESDYIILAVKPKDLAGILAQFTTIKPVLISFMGGGITTAYLEKQLAHLGQAHIIRAMPNTPMAINQGLIGISPGQYVTQPELETATNLLAVTGEVFPIPESLQSSFGALAGCGPAFMYLIAEALTDAAVAQGMPRHLAAKLSGLLMQGSAGMLLENPDQAAQLRADVTSPGGTTTIGIQQLEANGLRTAFYQALGAICTQVND